MTTIFCDEAGFTGPNLMDRAQEFFTYAGVAISFDDACAVHSEVARRAEVRSGELKFTSLKETDSGQRAITWMLNRLEGQVRFVGHHKRFALAGKFFEYLFEPVLAPNSGPFYEVLLHRFIQQLVFMHLVVEPESAGAWLGAFQDLVRKGGEERLTVLLRVSPEGGPWSHIKEFVARNSEEILDELDGLRKDSGFMNPWILDLTTTSMFNLLCGFGESRDAMRVICDEASPLKADAAFFDVMIGRMDRQYHTMGGATRPLTFNLSRPIEVVASARVPGVQLADICAGAARDVLERREVATKCGWGGPLESATELLVYPELNVVDPDSHAARVNRVVLYELVRRARAGESPFHNASAMIAQADQFVRENQGKF